MKKHFLLGLTAVAAMLLISCNKENVKPSESTQTITFTALTPDTKTHFGEKTARPTLLSGQVTSKWQCRITEARRLRQAFPAAERARPSVPKQSWMGMSQSTSSCWPVRLPPSLNSVATVTSISPFLLSRPQAKALATKLRRLSTLRILARQSS